MNTQDAKDQAAREAGYKDWDHAVYLMNEVGISRLTDKALFIMRRTSFQRGFTAGQLLGDGWGIALTIPAFRALSPVTKLPT